MVICKKCFVPMVGVMSFSKDKHEKYCRCPKCMRETRRQTMKDIDLSFGEVLRKTYKIK